MSPKALLLSIRELETNLWNQIKPESTVYCHCMTGSRGHTRPSSSPPSHQTSRVYLALGKAQWRRWYTQAGQLNNARTRRLLSPLSGWGTPPTWKLPSSAAWASPLSESHSEDETGRSMQSHEISTFSPSISHHSCYKLPRRGALALLQGAPTRLFWCLRGRGTLIFLRPCSANPPWAEQRLRGRHTVAFAQVHCTPDADAVNQPATPGRWLKCSLHGGENWKDTLHSGICKKTPRDAVWLSNNEC